MCPVPTQHAHLPLSPIQHEPSSDQPGANYRPCECAGYSNSVGYHKAVNYIINPVTLEAVRICRP